MRTLPWRLLILLVLVLSAAACTAEDGGDEELAGAEDPVLPDSTAGEEVVQAEPTGDSAGGDVLQTVLDRGNVVCGVNESVPGFGFPTADGTLAGFDIDYCRAVAAALFDDPDAVEFRPLTADQRFTALQSGEIDVLIRNTTRTALRDGNEGATFATTTFYDGQGMMVRTGEFESIDDMQNTTICVLSGTTTELNLASRFNAAGIPYEPLPFEDNETLQQAFIEGRCDGWTSDKSQLAGIRSNWPEDQGGPEALTILEETFSKEPLGPAVREGDPEWAQVVDWVVIGTMQAEEFGITSENVEEMKSSEDPEVLRFLGQAVEGAPFDPGLGFPDPEWAANMIAAVGNYQEIYDRNVGPGTPLGLEPGFNQLYTEGGLHYPPPYR